MIVDQNITFSKIEKAVQCELCRGDVKNKPTIKRLGAKFCVVCRECMEQFSEQEMELMANMFLAFGGYFNQYHSSKETQHQILLKIAQEYVQKERDPSELYKDVKFLHHAFLHGIGLTQLRSAIK